MACCLFGTKPLSESMLPYSQLDPKEDSFFYEILPKIQVSFKEMYLKISSVEWQPFCITLNVLHRTLKCHQSDTAPTDQSR